MDGKFDYRAFSQNVFPSEINFYRKGEEFKGFLGARRGLYIVSKNGFTSNIAQELASQHPRSGKFHRKPSKTTILPLRSLGIIYTVRYTSAENYRLFFTLIISRHLQFHYSQYSSIDLSNHRYYSFIYIYKQTLLFLRSSPRVKL